MSAIEHDLGRLQLPHLSRIRTNAHRVPTSHELADKRGVSLMSLFPHLMHEHSRNLTLTENGAIALNTTGKALLDLFAVVGAARTRSACELEMMFREAFQENPLLATKLTFYARNIRGGLGERLTARHLWRTLTELAPDTMKKNVAYIPLFGRWDDVYSLLGTRVEDSVWSLIQKQWEIDLQAAENHQPVSLMGKWLATPDTSSADVRRLGRTTARKLGLSLKAYTKGLRVLRRVANVVEVKMTAGEWQQIAYPEVPARAMMIYRNAFARHDEPGFAKFLQQIEESTAEVHALTLYPYDLMEKMGLNFLGTHLQLTAADNLLEAQWQALPNYVEGEHNVLVMADTSGSMLGRPLATSIGLAIYFAERNRGVWANQLMTFSEKPSMVKLQGTTLAERVACVPSIIEDTNLELAFELILDIAVRHHVPQAELPKSLVIISDMEINVCANIGPGYMTFYAAMKKRFADYGYEIPNVVFWNVASRHNVFHAEADIPGVQLVSGQSASAFRNVLRADGQTAFEMMVETLNDPVYGMIEL